MSFTDWVDESRNRVQSDGVIEGGMESAYRFYEGLWRLPTSMYNYGENVYEREWDALILLDTCRPDVLRRTLHEYPRVAPEYNSSSVDVPTMYSVGANSPEWLRNTFTSDYRDEIENTAYVTANPHSGVVEDQPFAVYDQVWKYNTMEDGPVHPEVLTDRAINVSRNTDADRLIVHYMQPHLPFRADLFPEGSTVDIDSYLGYENDGARNVYDRLRDGEISLEEVQLAYKDNLRWVLDHIETLFNNIDADPAVLSADHTELFGEYGLYCHPEYSYAPALRRVPWVETTAHDSQTYTPSIEAPNSVENDVDTRREQLENLGYL